MTTNTVNTPADAVGDYLSENPPTNIIEDDCSENPDLLPRNGAPFLTQEELHISVHHLARWLRANRDLQTGPADALILLNSVTPAMPSKRAYTRWPGHSSPKTTHHYYKIPKNILENEAQANPETPQDSG